VKHGSRNFEGEKLLPGKYVKWIALPVSVLSWYISGSLLLALYEKVGIPFEIAPTTRVQFDRDNLRFVEETVERGESTGAADLWMILAVVLARVVYKLIDRRTPISGKEKRWLVYIVFGYGLWAISGDWLRTPLDFIVIVFWWNSGGWWDAPMDAQTRTYVVLNLLHLAIGIGIIVLCRWDYRRTFPPIPPALPG